jgi:4-amino-4-deoxy-L-arabinose transferase-like glycosyltransferase
MQSSLWSRIAPPLTLALWIAALGVYRYYLLLHSGVNLYADEAYYFGWAQHLSFGYFSKPPMVAWLIALTTSMCGDGMVCVKLGAMLAYPITTFAVYLIGRELFDTRIGLLSGVAFYTLPFVFVSSLVLSTDAPLLLFWSLTLYFFIRALRTTRTVDWLLAGLCAGLGMLSKYTMVLFLVSALLYLWVSRRHRDVLHSPKLWGGVVVAAAVFLPNVIWNVVNRFATVSHTSRLTQLNGELFHPDHMLDFVSGQFLVFGLVFFFALLSVAVRLDKLRADDRFLLLWYLSVPFLLLFVLQSLLARAHQNWALPAYVAGTVLVVAYLALHGHRLALAVGIVLNAAVGMLIYHYHTVTDFLGIELSSRADPYKHVQGWDRVAAQVQEELERHPGVKLLVDERKLQAELIYYIRPHPFDAVAWDRNGRIDNQYELTTRPRVGMDYIYVTGRGHPKSVLSHFKQATKLRDIDIPLYPDFGLNYQVWYVKDCTGLGTASDAR